MGSILLKRKDNYLGYVKDAKPRFQKIKIRESTEWNYSYVQIVLESAEHVEILKENCLLDGIMIRRYFYPSLNELNYVNFKSCPIAENLSKSIVTLPSFFDLLEIVQSKVIAKLNE
jgi:dTDP-4-amino-4,6-dideoxygalactose transaminase